MRNRLNRFLDVLSEFLAHRKGLVPLVGLTLVIVSFIFQFVPGSWLGESDLFLHLGVMVAIIGFLLAWAL
ncbi:MAG TPA: hypothetical protein VI451_00030 [Anaerolineales bacterium]|nr:hypothetical protein [Anaerolineales bacterium]